MVGVYTRFCGFWPSLRRACPVGFRPTQKASRCARRLTCLQPAPRQVGTVHDAFGRAAAFLAVASPHVSRLQNRASEELHLSYKEAFSCSRDNARHQGARDLASAVAGAVVLYCRPPQSFRLATSTPNELG